jgi:hypothetical protein
MTSDAEAAEAAAAVEALADWSSWEPFDEAAKIAPTAPGVYIARQRAVRAPIYVGKAGPRDRGGKGTPRGLRGRLSVYASGKAIASGLGEAVFDRALADAAWLRERLRETEQGTTLRALDWGREAFRRADLEMRWAVTADNVTALALERQVGALLKSHGLWNRVV